MFPVARKLNEALDQFASVCDGPIGIAVSGGGDSRALLEIAYLWSRQTKRDIFALTVDHGLREEAAHEAEGVAARCKTLGIPHETLVWHHKSKRGSQARSRRARHALLANAVRAQGGSLLLMGHTYDDQLETLFMRRARIAKEDGQAGLAAMRALAVSPVWPEGRGIFIGRPCLNMRRADLRTYLQDHDLDWVEDPTNDDTKYERVRVRRELASGDRSELAETLCTSSEVRAAQDSRLADWLAAYVTADAYGLVTFDVADLPNEAVLAEGLAWLLMAAAGTDRRARKEGRDMLAADIIASPRGFRARTLGGAQIAPRRGQVHIARDPGMVSELPETPKAGMIWDGRFCLSPLDNMPSRGDLAQRLHGQDAETSKTEQVPALARISYPDLKGAGFSTECVVANRLEMVQKMLRHSKLQVSQYNFA